MEKQKEFTVFIGQLALGKYSEKEKREFLKWINEELKSREYGEELKPLTNKEIETKGLKYLNWETLSHLADVAQIVGFSYWFLPSKIKERLTVNHFIKKAKQWIEKHK